MGRAGVGWADPVAYGVWFFIFFCYFSQILMPFCKIHISSNIDPNEVISIVLGSV
jgi:hypothetical protein